jgi:hypothetical protein
MCAKSLKGAVFALMLAAGPTALIGQTQCVTPHDRVLVNDAIVSVHGATSLPAVLRRHVAAHRLSLSSDTGDQEIRVGVDGVALEGGIIRLADLRPEICA